MKINQKIRCLKFVLASLLTIGCLLMTNQNRVYASGTEGTTTSVVLSLEQRFLLNDKADESATVALKYCLEAVEAGNPMPGGSDAAIYQVTLTGNQTLDIDAIGYKAAGIYSYRIYAAADNDPGEYQYDDSQYEVTVYVKNAGTNSLIPEIVIKNKEGTKAESLSFTYRAEEESETPKPIDPGDSSDDPKKPSRSSYITTKRSVSVRTGDTTMPMVWLGIALAAAVFCVVLVKGRKSR